MKLKCSGPGPHDPTSGILGEADHPVDGMRCSSDACRQPLGSDDGARDAALAVIEAVRDPKVADPSVAQRLAALEALVVPPEVA